MLNKKPNETNPSFSVLVLHLVADVTEPERMNKSFERRRKKNVPVRYDTKRRERNEGIDCIRKYEIVES